VFANEEDLDNAATQSEENSQKLARDSHALPLLAGRFAGFLFVFRLTDLDLQWLQVKYLLTIFITDCYFLLVIELLGSECKVRNQSHWSPWRFDQV